MQLSVRVACRWCKEETAGEFGRFLQLPEMRDHHLPHVHQGSDDGAPQTMGFEVALHIFVRVKLWRIGWQEEQRQLAGLLGKEVGYRLRPMCRMSVHDQIRKIGAAALTSRRLIRPIVGRPR